MVVVGGLNPVAALEEAGIQTRSAAMSVLVDYRNLKPFREWAKELGQT
jgi:repressor of nif and glnA expression